MARLYYFDDLKILLILFVILIHSGLRIPNGEGGSRATPHHAIGGRPRQATPCR